MTWPLTSRRSLQWKRKVGVKTHWKPCGSFHHLHPRHLFPHHPVLCPLLSLPSPWGFSWKTWDLILSLCSSLFKISKYTKEYSLKSEPPAHLKHISTQAWFFFSCALNQNMGKKYLWTPSFMWFVKNGCEIIPFCIYTETYRVFSLKWKLNVSKWKERWRERKRIWSLKNCPYSFPVIVPTWRGLQSIMRNELPSKPRLSCVKKTW